MDLEWVDLQSRRGGRFIQRGSEALLFAVAVVGCMVGPDLMASCRCVRKIAAA
jgi:hypothetical protein